MSGGLRAKVVDNCPASAERINPSCCVPACPPYEKRSHSCAELFWSTETVKGKLGHDVTLLHKVSQCHSRVSREETYLSERGLELLALEKRGTSKEGDPD